MMTYRCEDVSDLIGPFALDALEPEERLLVLEHLSECRLHDGELAEIRDLAGVLPLAVAPVEPPVAARTSLLREFARQRDGPQSAPVAEVSERRGWFDFLRRPVLGFGLAAALAVAVVGLGVWNLSLQNDDGAFIARTVERGDTSLRVIYIPDEQIALLRLDLPSLTSDRVYQAWQLTGAGPLSLGLVPNRGATAIAADLSGASGIAISIEPAGGSAAPTTTPILVAGL